MKVVGGWYKSKSTYKIEGGWRDEGSGGKGAPDAGVQ